MDHLRRGDAGLASLLERSAVLMHPLVLGEIARGSSKDRASILELLGSLPAAVVAGNDEVMQFIDRHRLHGKGIGIGDVHLLASAALTDGATLWTRDRRLTVLARALGRAHSVQLLQVVVAELGQRSPANPMPPLVMACATAC